MIIASAGQEVSGAIASLVIPKSVSMMKRKRKGAHFLFGNERCAIPIIVKVNRNMSLRALHGMVLICAVQFDKHEARGGREVDVIVAQPLSGHLVPNVSLHPQPKYRRVDMRPLRS